MNYSKENKKQRSLAIKLFIALLFAILLSQLAGEYIAAIFVGLLGGLMPILLGALFAYLLKKPVSIFENKVFNNSFKKSKNKKKYIRLLSLSIIFFILLGVIISIIVASIPAIVNLANNLVNNSDKYIEQLTAELTVFFNNFQLLANLELQEKIIQAINNFAVNLESYLPVILDGALKLASDTTIIIFNVILSFILAFLILKDKEKISAYVKRVIYANFKTYTADNIIKTANKSDKILYSYFLGKLLEAVIIFFIVTVGFYIFNVPYAFVLASIIAILNFIPYAGVIISIVPTIVLTTIFASLNIALLAVIYSVGVVIFVTSFISPVIFGKQLNVSALLIILSIILGGAMFGIVGMLLAPPVLAIIAVLVNESIKQKENTKLIIKSYGVKEEDALNEEVLAQASKLVLEKKTSKNSSTKKPKD